MKVTIRDLLLVTVIVGAIRPSRDAGGFFMRRRVELQGMPPNAQQAFQTWLLKMEIIGGSVCLLIFIVCIAVTLVIIATSRKKEE